MKFHYISVALLLLLSACNRPQTEEKEVQTRTAGSATLLVDESFARILDDQITVFRDDYPKANLEVIRGNEYEIMPRFTKGEDRVIVLSRRPTPDEEFYYKQNGIRVNIDRFAVDGIALITNRSNSDSLIAVSEVLDIMKGNGGERNLVFDNAKSSTVRYFMDSAQVNQLPAKGVYTLETNNDVIKYVAEHSNFIGVVGVNWLLENNEEIKQYLPQIKMMGVRNSEGKKGADQFYQPTQNNLINGVYPFLRNIYIINCEGRDGLGTGFANWLCSPRGQLIVLKSGLGPHKIEPREFNLIKKN